MSQNVSVTNDYDLMIALIQKSDDPLNSDLKQIIATFKEMSKTIYNARVGEYD